jgi:maltokinase
MKLFRRVTPGANPDIEILDALTRAESTHVAPLYGYVEVEDLHLAMLQKFLRTASDGWELALASARNLFTSAEAEDFGGDFAAEAHRLGATLAEVHGVLAETFGTSEVAATETVATMAGRLSAAVPVVAELEPLAPALTARFEALGELGALEVQRIHGDLHLGQTLRTSLSWKLVDFEGEPAKDLAERRLPDSPWRDVAGMIRSFDYAAATVADDLGTSDDGTWTAHNTAAFLAGYAEQRGAPITAAEQVLVDAYVTDKAVYEAVYEARNRPGWLPIPLSALARMGTGVA